MSSALIIAQRCPGDGQHRAEPFAAAGNKMASQRRDQRNLALHPLKDYSINAVHVRGSQRKHRAKRGFGSARTQRNDFGAHTMRIARRNAEGKCKAGNGAAAMVNRISAC
jgi:hypothetical protein